MPIKAALSIREEDRNSRRKLPFGRREWILVISAWLVASAVLIIVDQARSLISWDKALRYDEGDLVEEDFFLPYDFAFLDEGATEKVRALNRSLAPPVYDVRGEITESVMERFDRFSSFLGPVSESNAYQSLRNDYPGVAGLLDREGARDADQMKTVLLATRGVLQSLQYAGVFRLDTRDGGAASGIIEVVYSDHSPERRVTLIRNAVNIPENLAERSRAMEDIKGMSEEDIEFIAALISYFSEPNGFINRALSQSNIDAAVDATETVTISLDSGSRLLKSGDVVTLRQAKILDALREKRDPGYHGILDPLLYMAFIFALGIVSGRNFGITLRNPKTLWLYISLSGAYLCLAALLAAFGDFQGSMVVVMPTALVTLLLAQLLQDRKMAVLSSILMALLIFFLNGENAFDFLVTLASGIGGTLAVRRRETRMGLLRAGPRLALVMFIITLLVGVLIRLGIRDVLLISLASGANGLITGILSLAFLPLLEHVLNTATTFRLIELSDQNVPILKRMRLQAPGTYIHSQNVAHLAEAACDAIGADGLLARVGAYYHDIGKVDQAHFFVENQAGENKHDDLKATLSVAVIKSHVKIGMEKGRDLRLPDEVLAVIEQHHGTSVIRYFYDRAQKEKGGDSANPEDFSYPGPKPRSREAAIVMLADNAEAATRTLKKPTAAKLEKYVWDLIMSRFKTGELNECDLTLRDLETVKDSFVQVLTGHFHSRIEYPKEKED